MVGSVAKSNIIFRTGRNMNLNYLHFGNNRLVSEEQYNLVQKQAHNTIKPAVSEKQESSYIRVQARNLPSLKAEEIPNGEAHTEKVTYCNSQFTGEVNAEYILEEHNYVAAYRVFPPIPPASKGQRSPLCGSTLGNNCPTQESRVHPFRTSVPPLHNYSGEPSYEGCSKPVQEIKSEEDTETASEGEEEEVITRCICEFEHDDGYMIMCDKCLVWQHVQCMFTNRANFPKKSEGYLCELCNPRKVNRTRAKMLQLRERERGTSSDTSSEDTGTETGKLPVQGSARTRRQSETAGLLKSNSHTTTNGNASANARRMPVRTKQYTASGDNNKMTGRNYYSPELQARISNIRVNRTYSGLNVSDLLGGSSITKCRVIERPLGTKMMVASVTLSANVPLIELRGKYTIANQQKTVGVQQTRKTRFRGQCCPFLFFYTLPKEGLEVCVDTKAYSRGTRYIGRSCKPNAEIRHYIENGLLHLYIVTISNVEKNCEITIKHDVNDLPDGKCSVCQCGNQKDCSRNPRINGLRDVSARDRRQRGGRNMSSDEDSRSPGNTKSVTPQQFRNSHFPAVRRRSSSISKSPTKVSQVTDKPYKNGEEKKLSREERKMEAIMKAIERLEKNEQKHRQHVDKQLAIKKDLSNAEMSPVEQSQTADPSFQKTLSEWHSRHIDSTPQPTQQTFQFQLKREESTDFHTFSGEETIKSEPIDPLKIEETSHYSSEVSYEDSSPSKIKTAADILVALSKNHIYKEGQVYQHSLEAEMPLPLVASSPSPNATIFNPVVCNWGQNGTSQFSTPPTTVSPACLFVEAALASDLQFSQKVPRNESPDLSSTTTPCLSPPVPAVGPFFLNSFTSHDKSLSTLVQAATHVGLDDSYPITKYPRLNPDVELANNHCLSQPISEEYKSPSSVSNVHNNSWVESSHVQNKHQGQSCSTLLPAEHQLSVSEVRKQEQGNFTSEQPSCMEEDEDCPSTPCGQIQHDSTSSCTSTLCNDPHISETLKTSSSFLSSPVLKL